MADFEANRYTNHNWFFFGNYCKKMQKIDIENLKFEKHRKT